MSQPDPDRRPERRPITIRWSIIVPVMALTWAMMAYAIYRLVGSARF